jgi:hypothetical protein
MKCGQTHAEIQNNTLSYIKAKRTSFRKASKGGLRHRMQNIECWANVNMGQNLAHLPFQLNILVIRGRSIFTAPDRETNWSNVH